MQQQVETVNVETIAKVLVVRAQLLATGGVASFVGRGERPCNYGNTKTFITNSSRWAHDDVQKLWMSC